MMQEISSRLSAFYKRGVPVILVGLFCYGLWGSLKQGPTSTSKLAVGMAVFGIVAAVVLYRCWKLKKVSADDRFIYVSNGKKEARIPFDQIESVYQNFSQRGGIETVAIAFKADTIFGSKIIFAPPFRLANFAEHPIVGELNDMTVGGRRLPVSALRR